MSFRGNAETVTFAGTVVSIEEEAPSFTLQCRSTDIIQVFVDKANYVVLTNIDGVSRDRTRELNLDGSLSRATEALKRYISRDSLVFVRGIHQGDGDRERFEARIVYLLRSTPDSGYVFEETHWWLAQISILADRWLDELFDASRNYSVEDFAKFYRTNLSISGGPTEQDPTLQECATLSRLIYGLSSAFLLTGSERYFLAARAAVDYQRQAFRSLTSDGNHCFWAFGRRKTALGSRLLFASEFADDRGAVPLYEQIYALAGLAQYYRITADHDVLEDIRRTLQTFRDFYRDSPEPADRGFPGYGGFFSHVDHVTMRPDTPALGPNQSKKNWNSIGDHIPAYLINMILALDPAPRGAGVLGFEDLRDETIAMLDELTAVIIEKFPDDDSDYVNERFHADWTPDHEHLWQQDRAIIGHNLKIAWNLTRCAFNLQSRAHHARDHGHKVEAARMDERARACLGIATRLGDRMAELGAVDPLRGGIFDAVERHPKNGMRLEFAWGSTKDFWQQEQAILAYLVLHAATGEDRYLRIARECMAFWNLFFLNRDQAGIFFRTTEGGFPIIEGIYGQSGSHSMSGYHSFELNYLAHLYIRTYVEEQRDDKIFCLYFHVLCNGDQESINVLPDFFPPGKIEIRQVRVNGLDLTHQLKPDAADDFQIRIDGIERNSRDGSVDLAVEFVCTEGSVK